MVTLRRARMYEFLDRLIQVALPQVRDFKGISDRSFDGSGNYSLGVREQIIFRSESGVGGTASRADGVHRDHRPDR